MFLFISNLPLYTENMVCMSFTTSDLLRLLYDLAYVQFLQMFQQNQGRGPPSILHISGPHQLQGLSIFLIFQFLIIMACEKFPYFPP